MEKAALVAGGVALIAYCAFGESTADKGDHNAPQLLHRLQPPPRRVLPPPIDHRQPADPIGLIPLARRLLPLKTVPPVRKPPVTGYSPCQMVVTGKNLNMQSVYDLPQLTTQLECETTYVPCNYPGAAACQQRWAPQ